MSTARDTGAHQHPTIEWSQREREVLDLIARGPTNGEIAEALAISFPTAKWHVSELITKLGVSSREEVAAYWRYERSVRGRASRFFRAIAGFGMLKVASGVTAVALIGSGAGAAVMAFGGEGGDVQASAVTAPAQLQRRRLFPCPRRAISPNARLRAEAGIYRAATATGPRW